MASKIFKNYVNDWYMRRYTNSGKFFYCQIHLLRSCQNNCVHCYFREMENKSEFQLSIENIKDIISKIKTISSELDLVPHIDYTGGDPLLHPHFFDIAEYTASQKLLFGIKGNPHLLNNTNLKNLKSLGVHNIRLSLEGLNDYNDSIRGKGSFKTTIEAVSRIKEYGLPVHIHTTISKFNMMQLIPLYLFFVSNDFLIDNFTWSRFWSLDDLEDCLSREQVENFFLMLVEFYDNLFSTNNFYTTNIKGELVPKIYIGFKEHLWFPFLYQKGYIEESLAMKIIETPNCLNCSVNQHAYIIDNNGDVYSCRKIDKSLLGNILRKPFDEMLSSANKCSPADSLCGSCKYFNGCGGCAAIGKSKTGSAQTGDPDCFIDNSPCNILFT